MAASEVSIVKVFWITAYKTRAAEFQWKGRDGKEKTESQLTTCDLLFELLNNVEWVVRAKAAELLAAHREVGVPEALLRAIERDRQLHVVREAARAWESVTGHRPPDVFGLPFVETWWKEHAEETKKRLQKLDCTP